MTTVNDYDHAEVVLEFDTGEGEFFDDLTKHELPRHLVKATKRKELEYFDCKTWKVMGGTLSVPKVCGPVPPQCPKTKLATC